MKESERNGTGQSGVDPVVLVPQPQDLLLAARHLVHACRRRLLKVSPAFLTAEEGPDVATHHLKHRSLLALQTCDAFTDRQEKPALLSARVCRLCTCVVQRCGRGLMLDGQNVKQSPEGARVPSKTGSAALATDPAKLRPQEHT